MTMKEIINLCCILLSFGFIFLKKDTLFSKTAVPCTGTGKTFHRHP